MPNNDSHQHVVKTSAQWNERAIEYWIVPRGCLCVELTGKGKTKIKVGEGDKNYYQLPYITDYTDLSNYYTKEEVNNLINNLEFMSIKSTEEYDSKSDLPLVGNELGDVRFVKSASPSIKIDPDVYLWNGTKWIFVGTPVSDMTQFVTKAEFNVVKDKVDEIYPKAHTHSNKEILDSITQADRDKFDDLHNYDDTEIRELIHETGHVHWNKPVLDQINQADLDKLDSLHNYDDTDVKNRLTVVEEKAHQHTNKAVLDSLTESKIQGYDSVVEYSFVVRQNLNVLNEEVEDLKGKIHYHDNIDILNYTTASYTLEQQQLLYELDAIDVFVGAGPTWNGIMGYVPAPEMGQQSYFLRADGTWAKVKSGGDKYKAGEGIYILSGEVASDTFPFKVYSRAGHLEQYIIYGNTGGVGDSMIGGVYGVNITITDEHGNSSNTSVILPEKISLGDYIDYGRQVFVHMRTNVSSLISSVDPSYNWRWAIRPDGSIQYTDIGAYGSNPQVTSLIELEPGITYELYHQCDYSAFANYMNLNVYDTEQNRTRTIHFYDPVGNVPTIIALASNEKYIRLTYEHANRYPYTLIRVKAVETPITLPQIPLFPNSINTINVTNTIKPAEIYVEVAEPSEDDPDDPMSDFTGIIYNDGVLDITQEDPNNLNELTVHFRDDVDKTITIPETPLEPATTTTLGGIIVGDNLTIDEDGVLSAKVKSGGDKYKAGEGIYILSGETTADSFPFKLYAKGGYLKQYIIYGAPGGVGDYNSNTGKYHIPIRVSAEGHTSIETIIQIDQKLYENDWINYELQEYSVYRTNLTNDFRNLGNQECFQAINQDGSITSMPGSWGYQDGISDYYEMDPDAIYELPIDTRDIYWRSNVNIYDENKNRTRTILRSKTSVVNIIPQPGEKYLRIAARVGVWEASSMHETWFADPVLYRLKDTVFPVTIPLQQIQLIPNTINTIDVLATVKPLDMYVETYVPEEPDPDDPMSEYTGIIYNDGILDVTQEDPNNLNELTFHYRDNVDKTLTIPTSELPIASDTTLGGIKVGNNLTIDPVTGVLDATGGSGETYAAGQGITFTHPGMTDLGFDFDAFVAKITSMHNGTKTVDSEHEVLTLTATGADCYTEPYSSASAQDVYTFPIVAGHVYRLTWNSSNPSVSGRIFAFENVSETNLHWIDQSVQDYLEFTAVTSGTINFRFGVANSGNTISYSNIHFYEMDDFDPDTTIINADIAKGLEFDSLDKLQVKLGDGLHFDSNDAIELDSNLYYPGQGIEFGGETLIPTEFNQSAFINVIGASRGNISKTPALDAFTLTATGDDCFTDHYEGWDGYYITAEPNTKYRVSWESANGTSGNMFVFEVSGTSYTGVMYIVNNANTNVNIFTTSSTCTKLSLRFGVASTGNSERYSNITFDKVVPLNNVIKAKLGDGLSFDSNDAITVDEMTGATSLVDGTSGTVPAPTASDNTKFLRGDATWVEINDTNYAAGQGITISAAASSEYTQVEYIKSTGTQYILTDIVPDYTMRIALDVKFGSTVLSSAKSVKKTFGYYNGGSTNAAFLAIWLDDDADHGNLDYICFYDGFRWVQGGPRTNELDDVDVTTRSTVVIQRGTCSWGSATCTTLDSAVTEPNPTTGMPIFAGFESNGYDIFGRRDMYLYSFKIYDSNSELIHNLIPVKRNADDEPGLYDLKTYKFYTNMGTGVFTMGSDVGPAPSDDQVISAKLGNGLHFDANGAIEADGVAYTASHGIEIVSDDIEASLGSGLTLDTNDAITLDEATKFILNCNNDPI